ncbi:MAG: tRNA preQ1(34) S-adenosylmethionine ribosyltransferase-isomerase QueA [Planctomycetales bacterium]|nr:tRNA preQ1(34) S-adenosylmethionine ribosyltransferase-isomerase QueA [Planctomycetales bacterium]
MSELDAYDYELPRERIAQEPLAHRPDARMLVVDRSRDALELCHVRDLGDFLRPDDLLVLNDTKVMPARLVGRRESTGGRWTGLFLDADESNTWRVLGKTRGRLQALERVILNDRDGRPRLALTMLAPVERGIWVARVDGDQSPAEVLEQVGRVPLPPYIRGGEMVDSDVPNYQTVFAAKPGAVAAPTAGLHFTKPLLDQLQRQGVRQTYVTLHVGIGTFRPIQTERLEDHEMHYEWVEVGAAAAQEVQQCRARGGRVVAVGTTVVRSLESAARKSPPGQGWSGQTNLFIRPPFEFQTVDALLTNFHLPKSSLLVLVHAFGGSDLIRRAYDLAIREELRFYSYGDAMLIV